VVKVRLYQGHTLNRLREIPDASVHCIVTSPPYWGLRNYGLEPQIWMLPDMDCPGHEWGEKIVRDKRGVQLGKEVSPDARGSSNGSFCRLCGAWRGSFGLEPTFDCLGWATGNPCGHCYICHSLQIYREVWRVLRKDGTFWLNIGDSYNGSGGAGGDYNKGGLKEGQPKFPGRRVNGLKPKDLCMIPARVALALQADGWWLRSDIIWCLSGGTWVYARTQKGDMPMMIRDIARLDPATVKFWNGKKWTQLLGVSQSPRQGDEIELVLRSGERISCTPTHQWPTNRGMLPAVDIQIGDVIESTYLPEPKKPKDCVLDEDVAWFAGLYIAEGSKSLDTIQLAGHSKETERLERVQRIAAKFGGAATVTIDGNKQYIRVYGRVLNAIIAELVTGRTAKDKGFAPVVWRYSNQFIAAMVDGYLSGDGHYEPENNRWRLGFTRNYNLERDLRTACARLGYRLVLNPRFVKYNGGQVPTFRGELRKSWNAHHNQIPLGEVVEIRKARCRNVYDLGVEDETHLFALASGVLTHNSKPNPMPESCTDRPTTTHEHIFLLTKSTKYFYDAEAVREEVCGTAHARGKKDGSPPSMAFKMQEPGKGNRNNSSFQSYMKDLHPENGRNLRSVWTIATAHFPQAHFATFPPAIPERCIKAGTSERGCCGAMVKKLKVRDDLTQEERLKVEAFLSSKGWL
jgi:DNA modification methylase